MCNLEILKARLDEICNAAHERLTKACADAPFLAGASCDWDFMTDSERTEVYKIKQEIMACNVNEKESARQRILVRRAARKNRING